MPLDGASRATGEEVGTGVGELVVGANVVGDGLTGAADGEPECCPEWAPVGLDVGLAVVGEGVGSAVGSPVTGALLGEDVGSLVTGALVGELVGAALGLWVGAAEGSGVVGWT